MGKITEGRIAETWDTCLTCQLCSRKFYSVAGFRSHLSQMHPKEWIEETRYSCLNCKKLFRSTELKQHYETAHFDQYNKCEFCDKLIKKGYLARHQRSKCRFIRPLKHWTTLNNKHRIGAKQRTMKRRKSNDIEQRLWARLSPWWTIITESRLY